ELKRTLGHLTHIHFIDDARIALAERIRDFARPLGLHDYLDQLIRSIKPAFALLKGEPSPEHLAGSGWRSRKPQIPGNPDPLDAEWGLMWISPVVPMTGTSALEFLSLVYPIFESHR